MKKFLTAKIAAMLLIFTFITSSFVGSTFAKYITTGTGSDTARVAKWGITVTMNDDLGAFKNQYATDDVDSTAEISNSVLADAEVVAPGTTGNFAFSVAGSPEVAVDLQYKVNVHSDISLEAGTYNGVEISENYNPIKFSVYDDPEAPEAMENGADLTLSELKEFIEALSGKVAPGTEIDKNYTVVWKWDFSKDENTDALDTYLGDEAAAQEIKFDIVITATQID